MARRTISWVLILCILGTTIAIAGGNEESIPSWVPWTLVATTVAAGILYFVRWHNRDEAPPKSPKEAALDLTTYVSTGRERDELKSLTGEEEVKAFLARFFEERDPTPETPENEFRRTLTDRYVHANKEFRDHREGWKTDRGRAYILYGPPAEVRSYSMVDWVIGKGITCKGAEIWVYERAAGPNQLPPILANPGRFYEAFGHQPPLKGQMLFFFSRLSTVASYEQIFSTEQGERIDQRIY